MAEAINMVADVSVIETKSKPYLRVKFETGQEICLSTNLAEMIGGVAAGARVRYQEEMIRNVDPI